MAARDRERLEKLATLCGFATVTEFAEFCDVKPGTAQKHKERRIPAKAVPKYQKGALRRGVTVSGDWLQWGNGPMPKPPPENFIPKAVGKFYEDDSSHADKDSAFRITLWHLRDQRQDAGATVPALVETDEDILAPQSLREFRHPFAVRMWDSSNGPYVPRGMILYVERPHDGSPGHLCLFAHSHSSEEVVRPLVGILDKEDDDVWHVIQHAKTLTLPKAEYRVCWRIRTTRRD